MQTCFIFLTYPPFKLNVFDTTANRPQFQCSLSVQEYLSSIISYITAILSVFNNDSNIFNNDSKVFLTNIHLSTSNVDLFSIASLAACTIYISGKKTRACTCLCQVSDNQHAQIFTNVNTVESALTNIFRPAITKLF